MVVLIMRADLFGSRSYKLVKKYTKLNKYGFR
jgi:hypothetical protein